MQVKRCRLLGSNVAYLENRQDGRPILFVHGNSCAKEVFTCQLNDNNLTSYRLIALDLPGHGDSEKACVNNDNRYSIAFYVSVIKEFIATLNLVDPIIVGHSLGGHIALNVASQIKVGGLVSFQAPPFETSEDLAKGFMPDPRFGHLMKGELSESELDEVVDLFFVDENNKEFIKSLVKMSYPETRTKLGESLVSQYSYNEKSLLKKLSCKTTIIVGENDPIINSSYVLDCCRQIDNIRVVSIKSFGHFPQIVSHENFNNALYDFLDDSVSLPRGL